jgi:hypothetical protein
MRGRGGGGTTPNFTGERGVTVPSVGRSMHRRLI